MQAVWGETWWRKKKRRIQNDLEDKRRREYEDRMADSTRLEAMRQRRIKRKMGACAYHCWPCGRAEYDKMFPKPQVPVIDPAMEEAERLRKVRHSDSNTSASKKKNSKHVLGACYFTTQRRHFSAEFFSDRPRNCLVWYPVSWGSHLWHLHITIIWVFYLKAVECFVGG